jgi:cyclic pyranopterin phosphate synthase
MEYHEELDTAEVLQIIQAAYNCGIRRIHWTGGEPTLRKDFTVLVRGAKDIGYSQQIITTNGFKFFRIIDECIDNGLTRVIISLDTLSEERNKILTGRNFFRQTLRSIEVSVMKLSTLTKINVATMRSTLPEIKAFVEYVQDVNRKGYPGRLALKLIEFCPNNPAQLLPDGQELFRKEWVSEEEIIKTLKAISSLKLLPQGTVEGDNPSCRYYSVGDTKVIVGVLAMPSWNYPCGRCHKLRIIPFGRASVCLSVEDTPLLKGRSLEKQTDILKGLMSFRDRLDKVMPSRKHYRAQLGEMRFGKTEKPVCSSFFDKFHKRR